MFKIITILFCVIQLMNCKITGDLKITPIKTPRTNLINLLYWDVPTQSLYFTDFATKLGMKCIHRYDYETGNFYSATIPGEVSPSFIIPVHNSKKKFLVGLSGGVKVICWNGISKTAKVVKTLFSVFGHLNYATVDSKGRLFTATINNTVFCSAPSEFATYRYDSGKLTTIFNGNKSSTGLAINEKAGKFYYGDACLFQHFECDYSTKSGNLCNCRLIKDWKKDNDASYPALGVSIDTDGMVIVTLYGSSKLVIMNSGSSEILREIILPSLGLTDTAYGGPEMDKLFVAAGHYNVDVFGGALLENRTQDAALYIIEGLGRGYYTPRARI